MLGCLGSLFRFLFMIICCLVVIWFGAFSIINFFTALFGDSWLDFWKMFGIWVAASYGIGWILENYWHGEDGDDSFFAAFVLISSIYIYNGMNKLGKKLLFIRP